MNFLENIFGRLAKDPGRVVIEEVRAGDAGEVHSATAGELLALVRAARSFLALAGVRKGDRCALFGNNSVQWVALDLALMAEGIVVVPLYARQAPAELAVMIRDSGPALVCCGDSALADSLAPHLTGAKGAGLPRLALFKEVYEVTADATITAPRQLRDKDTVTIIYTSGTSGEPKGVMLNAANLDHMLGCTSARLDLLMGEEHLQSGDPDQVFHYLPFCFAGSWILLLSCLSRHSVLALSTDLSRLADELKLVTPHYFLNVPALLERVRGGIEQQVARRGGAGLKLYQAGKSAWFRKQGGERLWAGQLWIKLAEKFVFSTIRAKVGANLKALICGSAPLAKETQLFFMMLGIPVLQVYGLTETTGICTMDHPRHVTPGRVGPAVADVEMKLGEDDEILVRGPNLFPGYWNRQQETAKVIRDGWFHSGDQGERDSSGNWRIIGRVKNLIILGSGHNIPPEPIEEQLQRALGGANQVVLTGHGRAFLAALVTGEVSLEKLRAALDELNPRLPHYKRIHAFHIHPEPFTIENGLLTANGKLKRDAIAARLRAEIDAMYRQEAADKASAT